MSTPHASTVVKRAVTPASHICRESRRFARRSRAHDPHLRDAPAVNARHLEAVSLYLDPVTDGGETAEPAEDETADPAVRLVRPQVVEPPAPRTERREAV